MRLYELYALSHPLFVQAPETLKCFERLRPRPMASCFVQGLNGGNYQVTSTVDSLQLRTRAGFQPVLFEVRSASISLICAEM